MADEITWTGRNAQAVSTFLFPIANGTLTTRTLRGQRCLSLLAFGVLYDLPVGCRIVRTTDGTVSASGGDEPILWLDENTVHRAPMKIWNELCEPTTTEED